MKTAGLLDVMAVGMTALLMVMDHCDEGRREGESQWMYSTNVRVAQFVFPNA